MLEIRGWIELAIFSTVVNIINLQYILSGVVLDFSELDRMGNKGTRITFDEKLHGTNVVLSKGGVVASRVNKSKAVNTIAYVEQEVPKGVKIEIRVEEKNKQTEGSMVSQLALCKLHTFCTNQKV